MLGFPIRIKLSDGTLLVLPLGGFVRWQTKANLCNVL
jgi:hypothetical protein